MKATAPCLGLFLLLAATTADARVTRIEILRTEPIPGLPATNNLLRIDVPTASAAGPIEQTVWDELLFNDTKTTQARLTFRALSPETATLMVRDRNADEPTVVPADQWEFVDAQTVR